MDLHRIHLSSLSSTPTMIQGTGEIPVWRPVPGVVEVMRVLLAAGLVVTPIAALLLTAALVGGIVVTAISRTPLAAAGVVMIAVLSYIVLGSIFVLTAWMYRGMDNGLTAVWYTELVILVIGCLSVFEMLLPGSHPALDILGAAIDSVILYFWLKPVTKAYFNVR